MHEAAAQPGRRALHRQSVGTAEFDVQLITGLRYPQPSSGGDASYASLKPEEQLRFDHFHGLVMNVVENWCFQVTQTSDPGLYRDAQLGNVSELIRKFCDHPGFMQFWVSWSSLYPPEVHALVEKNVGATG